MLERLREFWRIEAANLFFWHLLEPEGFLVCIGVVELLIDIESDLLRLFWINSFLMSRDSASG